MKPKTVPFPNFLFNQNIYTGEAKIFPLQNRSRSPNSIRMRMSYVLRVRLASFFTGAAVASAAGLYFLKKDYQIAHVAISEQMNSLYKSLDGRVSELEKVKEVETPKHEAAAAEQEVITGTLSQ